jgi:uncharacterized protein YbcV (DUF1398 family)
LSDGTDGKTCQSIEFLLNNHEGDTMNSEQVQVIQECARGALSGELAFPEIVGRLAEIGVERYHADYSRQEITYYFPDNSSLVVATPHPSHPTAAEFVPSTVEAAVRQSQRNEHTYLDFIRTTMAAGCVGYFVQITGRRVIYFGRNGDSHVEYFPPAPVNAIST